MSKTYIYLFIFFSVIVNSSLAAQTHDHDHDHDHEHEHDVHVVSHHEHHKNEFAIANIAAYFTGEEELSYGIHMHFVRSIGDSKFGVGLGYERIFDEHEHQTYGVVFSYRPSDPISFNVSPGITFEGEEDAEKNFALHLETAYEFEFNNFHIGPMLEVAYDPEDYHISLGLHIGYGF